MDKYPDGHSPRYWKRHPEALRASKQSVVSTAAVPDKGQLSKSDTWTILGVLLSALFVFILPPLYLKVPGFILVCVGLVWLAYKSRWFMGWTSRKKASVSITIVVVLSTMAVPQLRQFFVFSEHP